jgi:predicted ABC-type ATPase
MTGMGDVPTIYILAGPNGSGKTTLAREFLPRGIHCLNFLNADLLAQGLSPFDVTVAGLRAGRFLLQEFDHNVANGISFGIETTLSGLTYLNRFKDAKEKGFRIVLFYIWVGSAKLSIERIKHRVSKGGHHVPSKDVIRRFGRSIRHFFNHYRPLADKFYVFDNRDQKPVMIAFGTSTDQTVIDATLYTELLSHHD